MKQNPDWEKEELIREAVAQIKNRIEQQNYAAAEDLLNRVLTQDLDPEFQFKKRKTIWKNFWMNMMSIIEKLQIPEQR